MTSSRIAALTTLDMAVRFAIALSREMGYWQITVYRAIRGATYYAQDHRDDPPPKARAVCVVVAAEVE